MRNAKCSQTNATGSHFQTAFTARALELMNFEAFSKTQSHTNTGRLILTNRHCTSSLAELNAARSFRT